MTEPLVLYVEEGKTISVIRNWRECEGPLPWQKSKMPLTLLGFPVVFTENLLDDERTGTCRSR